MNRMNGERLPPGWRVSVTNNPPRVLAGCAVIPVVGRVNRPCRNVVPEIIVMSKKRNGDYKIPFDDNGNQLDYQYGATVWMDNHEFDDLLTYHAYSRGMSSVTVIFTRSGGGRLSMFMTDFNDVVPFMVKGKLRGRFTFVKRGQNYGARLIEADDLLPDFSNP
jgi:hypothetical protein